jgi:hypothetical protein
MLINFNTYAELFQSSDNQHEMFYQILFYQEPSSTKFLHNRSTYSFPPAINGDMNENNHELHSFFVESLKETFWVAYDSDIPGYLQLPKGITALIETEYFEFEFYIDFYILTDNVNYVLQVADSYKYPLITVLDSSGQEVFSIWHSLSKSGFSAPNTYEMVFTLIVNGESKGTKIYPNTEFYRTSNTYLKLQFHRAIESVTRLECFFIMGFTPWICFRSISLINSNTSTKSF